jgi:hypothetical protein
VNICVCFVEMILQSSLTLCPTPAAAGFRTEQWATMMLFDMTLHICQARKVGVTIVNFARNTKYSVELVGHGEVEGRRRTDVVILKSRMWKKTVVHIVFHRRLHVCLSPHRPLSMPLGSMPIMVDRCVILVPKSFLCRILIVE